MMKKIRIFVSSPSDVSPERIRVERVIKRIESEYSSGVKVEIVRWEEEYYSATSTFQEQIVSSADSDIVICILWKRLGSALPDDFSRKDGSSRTGTEFEFEEALQAALTTQSPDILLYRKSSKIMFDAERVEQEKAELQSLELFWRRWVQNEKGHFTAGFKSFEDTEDFESVLEKDLRAWFKRRFHTVTWPESKGSPYRGLDVFEPEHFPIYFGRRRVISEVRARLIANAERDNIGFLLIIGASGSGKSSLVRAGLIPTLKTEQPIPGVSGWRELIIRPSDLGDNWRLILAQKMSQTGVLPEILDGDFSKPSEISELWNVISASSVNPVKSGLKRWGQTIAQQEGQQQSDARLLIVLDQLEELFQWPKEQQVAFLNLFDSFSRSGVIWVVATMRSDFYPQLFALPELMALKESSRQYDLASPNSTEMSEIINGPATASGLTFEKSLNGVSLADKLQLDAEASPAALPLLEFTLEQLYNEREREQKLLTYSSYEKLGGLQGALTETAETVFQDCMPQFKQSNELVFANVMRELVAIGEDGKATRRIAKLESFKDNKDEQLLVHGLIEKRLLRSYSDNNAESEAMVDITHEALIGHWNRLQKWLESDRELLQVRDRLQLEQQRWLNSHKNKDLLATSGKRLQDLLFLENSQLMLDETIIEFVIASKKRAKIIKRRKTILLSSFGMISLLAAAFGVVTLSSIDKLEDSKSEASEKQEALDKTYLSSARLVAESEYSRANVLLQQSKNRDAVMAYVKAMERATQKKNQDHRPTEWISEELPSLRLSKTIDHSSKLIYTGKRDKVITSKDNNLVAIISESDDSSYQSLSVFDTKESKLLFRDKFRWDYSDEKNIQFSPEGKFIALLDAENNSYRVYNLKQPNSPPISLKNIPNQNVLFRFLNESSVVVLIDNELMLWDSSHDTNVNNIQLITDGVESFHVLDDKTLLVDGTELWKEVGEWQLVNQIDKKFKFGESDVFYQDGNVIKGDGVAYIISNYIDTWMPDLIVEQLYSSVFRHFFNMPKVLSYIYKVDLSSKNLNYTLLAQPKEPKITFKANMKIAGQAFISADNKSFYVTYYYASLGNSDFVNSDFAQQIVSFDVSSDEASDASMLIEQQGKEPWGQWMIDEIGGHILVNNKVEEVAFYSKNLKKKMGHYLEGYFFKNKDVYLIINEDSISSISNKTLQETLTNSNPPNNKIIRLNVLSRDVKKSRKKDSAESESRLKISETGLALTRNRSSDTQEVPSKKKRFISDVSFQNHANPMMTTSDNLLMLEGIKEVIFDCEAKIVKQLSLVNEVACLTEQGLYRVWNTKTQQLVFEYKINSNIQLAQVNNGRLFAFTDSGYLILFNKVNARWQVEKKQIDRKILSLAIGDQQVMVGGTSGYFALFDLELNFIKRVPNTQKASITQIAISKDNTKLVLSTDKGLLEVFSVGDVQPLGTFDLGEEIKLISITSNRLVAASKKGKLLSWDVTKANTNNIVPIISDITNGSSIIDMNISFDEQWLTLVNLENNISIFDLNTGVKSLNISASRTESLIATELSKDNWTLNAVNRLGELSSIEVGNQLFTKKQAELFKVLASSVLFRQGVIETKLDLDDVYPAESSSANTDISFWTQWIEQVSTCGFSALCQAGRAK